jgi:ketosteroid isomerase-like protein
MTDHELAYALLQLTYYDSIDRGDMASAVAALHEDIEWSHVQVWEHHDYRRRDQPTRLNGRQEVETFLSERIGKLREAGIRHRIRHLVCEGSKGAFLAAVEGPGGEVPFFVWFELRDGKVARYLLRPC